MSERELDDGWDLARPAASVLSGVSMAGFCDRASTGSEMRIFARPEVVVVVQFGESALVRDSGRPAREGLVAGVSPGTHRVRGDRVECVEVRLSPVAAYRLLGVAPIELNGTVSGLDDLWGPAAGLLREQLAETSGWGGRFAATTRFLAARESARAVDPEVGACWDRILADRGDVRVRDLAELTGWSRKRLWHRFTAQLGVTPKHAAMVVRFRRAFDLLLAGRSAAEVAAVCGYADQSHLHREVSAFAGTTPGALARR
ncbi:helix-turn-helix domain-containing protein [Nocardia sp. NPDC058176]|uniref:helix-turn-helix domain-containing protein n=1 Tax=Nocardia sp. NPDC058176 TaxID=3346368 RepID=UPI0036D9D6A7